MWHSIMTWYNFVDGTVFRASFFSVKFETNSSHIGLSLTAVVLLGQGAYTIIIIIGSSEEQWATLQQSPVRYLFVYSRDKVRLDREVFLLCQAFNAL